MRGQNHVILKAKAHGIKDNVLAWIQDFLSGRTQRVAVSGALSEEADVTSGIPQGSVLGPLLFVLYINDLPGEVENEVRLFADDTKLFACSDTPDGIESLQKDLNSLQEWSDKWLLRFHPEKCHVLKLGSSKSSATYSMTITAPDGTSQTQELEETQVEKDLGVHVDNDLSFRTHITQAASKANRVLGVMRRSFDFLSNDTFLLLYKALVRPLLEYGHSVWNPHYKYLKKTIEDVQRRATRMLSSMKDMSYPERLRALDLPSLEHRRIRGDMIDTFKYVHGLYKSSRPELPARTCSIDLRGHSLMRAKRRCEGKTRAAYFSERVVDTWNLLPEKVVTAPTVNAFKNRLDKHWINNELKFNPTCYEKLS